MSFILFDSLPPILKELLGIITSCSAHSCLNLSCRANLILWFNHYILLLLPLCSKESTIVLISQWRGTDIRRNHYCLIFVVILIWKQFTKQLFIFNQAWIFSVIAFWDIIWACWVWKPFRKSICIMSHIIFVATRNRGRIRNIIVNLLIGTWIELIVNFEHDLSRTFISSTWIGSPKFLSRI